MRKNVKGLGEIPLFFKIGEEPEKIKKTQDYSV
jgi:hypothetical protein